MSFFRFEDFERNYLTPNLSSGEGPVIEGKYMYFCNVFKEAGTGSELHYHPNELLIFPLEGKLNAIVGKDRRIVGPGTFVHAPAFARHSMKATEEGPVSYLYVKDQTWTVVGVAANEAPPEKALSVEEVNKLYKEGKIEDRKGKGTGATEESKAIIEGLGNCYYDIMESLDEPNRSARRMFRIEGERLAFEFSDLPPGYTIPEFESGHEKFIYMMTGRMDAEVGGETKTMGPGDIVQIKKGAAARMVAGNEAPVRYAAVESMPYLEKRVDEMRAKEGK
ncbi:MAG: cupin domain-containing protein [Rhodospirillales bacterium]